MDPYLEDSEVWRGFHQNLAVEIQGQFNTRASSRYYADVEIQTIEQRVGISLPIARHITYPDVGVYEQGVSEEATRYAPELPAAPLANAHSLTPIPAPVRRSIVTERFTLRSVRIYQAGNNRLVTSIEILSPYNKKPGHGLSEYVQKRDSLLSSTVHLIEIDLLRGGERPGPEVAEPPLDTDYVILVNRAQPDGAARVSEIWPVAIGEALPPMPVPLLEPDPDVLLDLNEAIRSIYARAAYERRIDYRQAVPPPPLRPSVKASLKEYLRDYP
jgi:hypothetical protein